MWVPLFSHETLERSGTDDRVASIDPPWQAARRDGKRETALQWPLGPIAEESTTDEARRATETTADSTTSRRGGIRRDDDGR